MHRIAKLLISIAAALPVKLDTCERCGRTFAPKLGSCEACTLRSVSSCK